VTLPEELLATGADLEVRSPDPETDAIDGVLPGLIVAPRTPVAVAAALAWLSERRLSTVIRGNGTRSWGRPPARVDVSLETRHMRRVLSHRQGDLTATVEAGLSLADLNRTLAPAGQWLPLDPPFGAGTIGGALATNDSGPQRHRFGTPRDLVIGIHLATCDGRLVKAGGQVVKNVAGYDLSKVMSGSFGSLAVIVAATFKLSPLPGASATLVINRVQAADAVAIVERLAATQLEPVALEVRATRGRGADETACLLRFASVPAAVDAQVTHASRLLEGVGAPQVLTGNEERELWHAHEASLWEGDGAIVRVSWPPARLAEVFRLLEDLAAGGALHFRGRAGVGSGLIAIEGDDIRGADAVRRLRSSSAVDHVLILRGSPGLKRSVDVWPALPNAPLIAEIKKALDPNGILGAGRGGF